MCEFQCERYFPKNFQSVCVCACYFPKNFYVVFGLYDESVLGKFCLKNFAPAARNNFSIWKTAGTASTG